MTKIRIVSDLHSEFWGEGGMERKKKWLSILNKFVLPETEDDKETILILAGDTGDLTKIDRYNFILGELSSRFKSIIWCSGNHEWYGGDWEVDQKTYTDMLEQYENVHDNYYQKVDGINFIITSLWTDFNNNPISIENARFGMSDYKWIKRGDRNLTPEDTILEHTISLYHIQEKFRMLREKEDKDPVIVVTHHAPSYQSIGEKFKGSTLNPAFASNLDYLIEEYQPNYWIHGHMHNSSRYNIGKTEIICNPYGYHGYEGKRTTGYDPKLLIEV